MHKLCIFKFFKIENKNVIEDIPNDNEIFKIEFANFENL